MLGSGLSGRFTVRKGTRRHAIVNSTLNRPVKWRGGRVAIATRERSDAPRNLNRYYSAMRPTDVVRVGVSHRSETPAHVRGREAVIDRRRLRHRCFHLGGGTLGTRRFRCRYIGRDIICEHDVMNIQHAHCGPVGPDCKK